MRSEKSPYLLQHADNPVDWYPWGEEAFAAARRENKPIFLSIGYSTCHWCHVMAHESFEDEDVARLMNDTFISIKVDREERPDIDTVYMAVCQMMTGGGGWPLTILMTPDKEPFFAATYIPKESRFGQIGLLEFIPHINELWESQKESVMSSANQIKGTGSDNSASSPGEQLSEDVLHLAFQQLSSRFDETMVDSAILRNFPPRTIFRSYCVTGKGQAMRRHYKWLRVHFKQCVGEEFTTR